MPIPITSDTYHAACSIIQRARSLTDPFDGDERQQLIAAIRRDAIRSCAGDLHPWIIAAGTAAINGPSKQEIDREPGRLRRATIEHLQQRADDAETAERTATTNAYHAGAAVERAKIALAATNTSTAATTAMERIITAAADYIEANERAQRQQ